MPEIDLPSIVGRGYASFWENRNRYRVLKGGRASKKSRTMGLWSIYNVMKRPLSNMLVVRNTYNTHKDSTFAVLKWAAHRLGVFHLWKFTESPLEARYMPTGQKILFRGCDDTYKITSIDVEIGVICWVWFEEAFEIEREEDFDTIDETIRGEMPPGLWKQITLTYNPWVSTHWTKSRFWDKEHPNTFRLTTTYKCNEFIDDADRAKIEALRITNPQRYKVVGLGEYGNPGGSFYEEFDTRIHVIEPFEIPGHWRKIRGMDYGFDMLAVVWAAVDDMGYLVIYKETYQPGLTLTDAALKVKCQEVPNEQISYTVASPDLWRREGKRSNGTITGKHEVDYMIEAGLTGLVKADNSRIPGWRTLREYLKPIPVISRVTGLPELDEHGNPKMTARIRWFNTCAHSIRTISSIVKDERDPEDVADEPHEVTHMPEATRYLVMSRPPLPKIETVIPGANRNDIHIRHKKKAGPECASEAAGY